MRLSHLMLLALGALSAACSKEPQLIVVVQSDYGVPAELSVIEVSVSGAEGTPVTHSFNLSETPLPLSFGVLAPGGDRTQPLSIEIKGVGPIASQGPVVRRRLARFPEVTSRLGIFLARSCQSSSCPAEQSCTERGCIAELLDVADLSPVNAGEELDGLCIPGPGRCSSDGRGVVRCSRFGAPEAVMACPEQQMCLPDPARCSGGVALEARLNVSISGNAEGRVVSAPPGIDCGMGQPRCEAVFPRDTNVRLSVLETTGTFGGWSGACSGGAECNLRMDADRQVSATFVLQSSFLLTVTPSGEGNGMVTSDPAGIACGTSCSFEFAPATVVSLVAEPDPESTFVGWSGACSGSGACAVTMSSALLVGAEFARNTGPQTLSVLVTGDGEGAVVSSPSGINCGAACTAEFPFSSAVVLSAEPGPGSVFSGWQGASCSGTQPCQLSMDQPHAVGAEFIADTGIFHRVAVTKRGSGDGEVQSSDGAIVCGPGCTTASANFLQGSTVQLRVTPAMDATFDGWADDCASAGTSLVCSLSVDAPKNATANFSRVVLHPVQITINGGGRVTGPGIDCPGDCTESFPSGAAVPLTAIPPSGRQFVAFQGGGCAQYSPCTVNIGTSGHNIVASFQPFARSRFDLNDDGLADLVFAAPDLDVQGSSSVLNDAGRVYIRFGGLSGPALPPEVASSADRIYSGGMSGARFGASVAVLDDITGDGYPDLAVGAPGENGGAGTVRIIPGGPGLPASGPTTSLTAPPGVVLVGLSAMRLGASLAAMPDQDGDGLPELLVGAPGDNVSPGDAYLFMSNNLGSGGGVGLARIRFTGSGGGFGSQVTVLGDFNGDTLTDLAIAAPTFGPQTQGQVAVYFGPFMAGPVGVDRLPDWTVVGSNPAQNAGDRIIGIGDLNADGHSDLAIAARNQNNVFIFYGGPSIRPSPSSTANADMTFTGGGFFGSSLAAGDVTGDRITDLLVGATLGSGPGRGTISVFAGGQQPVNTPWATLSGDCSLLGTCTTESFGQTIAVWGDLNRDGTPDIVTGSNYGGGAAGNLQRGRITAFYGGPGLMGSSSSGAPIQIAGEDQLNGHCYAIPTGRAQ